MTYNRNSSTNLRVLADVFKGSRDGSMLGVTGNTR